VTNNSMCPHTNVPELQIPDKYNTFGTPVGLEVYDADFNADANKTYDLLMRQTIPLVIVGQFNHPESNLMQSSVEFVCMTASKTVEGGRVSEQETPWKSAGAGISARTVGWVAGVVTTVMLLS
jgi:hypothetical protein